MHRRGTLWVGGMIAMSGSSNHIAARLIHRAPREAGCPRSLALGDRGMIGKWPAHQPRRFTLSLEKLERDERVRTSAQSCSRVPPVPRIGDRANKGRLSPDERVFESHRHAPHPSSTAGSRVPPVPRTWGPGNDWQVARPSAPKNHPEPWEAVPRRGTFGSVGTIAMSGSSNPIATRLIHRAPREAGCPRSLALGDRGMIGKWPAHQPRRITLSRGKLCPVGVPFGSVGTIAMSGSSNPIATRLIHRAPREAGCPGPSHLGTGE